MNMRMIFGTMAAAVALAGCVSVPKVDNAPVATQDEIIKCPEIRSDSFSLEMPGLKVEMGKMPEKYDQVHILNSSSRRKQQ